VQGILLHRQRIHLSHHRKVQGSCHCALHHQQVSWVVRAVARNLEDMHVSNDEGQHVWHGKRGGRRLRSTAVLDGMHGRGKGGG
jgi:hypothetical protein